MLSIRVDEVDVILVGMVIVGKSLNESKLCRKFCARKTDLIFKEVYVKISQ
jgi:hypothetical protein